MVATASTTVHLSTSICSRFTLHAAHMHATIDNIQKIAVKCAQNRFVSDYIYMSCTIRVYPTEIYPFPHALTKFRSICLMTLHIPHSNETSYNICLHKVLRSLRTPIVIYIYKYPIDLHHMPDITPDPYLHGICRIMYIPLSVTHKHPTHPYDHAYICLYI